MRVKCPAWCPVHSIDSESIIDANLCLKDGRRRPRKFPCAETGRASHSQPYPFFPHFRSQCPCENIGSCGFPQPRSGTREVLGQCLLDGEAPVGAAVNETSAAIFHSKRQEGTPESFQESPRDFLWDSSLFPETISKLFIPSCLSPFSPYSYSVGPGRLESGVPIWQGCVEVSPGGNHCPGPSSHLSTFI